MRITNGMMTGKYSRNLNSALTNLDYYNNRATTLRKFDKVSEDPVAASKAFRLRRSYYENDYYQESTSNAENQLLTAETAMRSINTYVQEISSGDILQSITGTSGKDERAIVAAKIRKTMEAIVGNVNTQYGDKYVFGGSDTSNPPLAISKDGTLTYRGVDVNTGKLVNEDGAITSAGGFKVSFGEDNGQSFNGYKINIVDDAASPVPAGEAAIDQATKTITVNMPAGSTGADLQNALQNANAGGLAVDLSKITVSGDLTKEVKTGQSAEITDTIDLKSLANEKVFVDLGMGLDVNATGDVNAQSAFNIALPALDFLGYGYDDNGNPKNIYNLLDSIATELENDNFSLDKVNELSSLLNKQETNLLSNITEVGVRTNFLVNTKTRLEDSSYNLSVQINETEYLDFDEAIMDYKLQEYIYQAALSMGSKVIQPSFLDYMK